MVALELATSIATPAARITAWSSRARYHCEHHCMVAEGALPLLAHVAGGDGGAVALDVRRNVRCRHQLVEHFLGLVMRNSDSRPNRGEQVEASH